MVEQPVQPTSQSVSQQTQGRKADHLRICLDEDVQSHRITNGFERYRFTHCCLPELNRDEIDLGSTFLGKAIATPLLISSMTGGTEQAQIINQRLAKTAQRFGLAMGVGSQRVAVENPALTPTFSVRQYAPDALLFANLGAVQLNYDYGIEQCQKAVDALEADALILHLNPLQEAVQTEGDVNFKGLFTKIERLAKMLPVPVVAKEVGNGISASMARRLIDAGVAAIDVAGAGGTSWARVESERAQDAKQRRLGNTFADWGIPTAECLTSIRSEFKTRISSDSSELQATVPLIASGGLRNGLDAAKAIALGADLVGMALPFLQAASQSEAALAELSEALIAELTTVLFCTGSESLRALRQPGVITSRPL
ncbi:type 2 isopentenyl-diphosphate Delta-isomerase [cf. Phormidesmis sp. LEGE 11477]|nr:type 2 isopentenyl-diphosphate Delta-isomerase [cf. Phormidesmis sp. LEGE 11477]MBE9061923.1 type 2 isopentenyl-diphosphate Delta-isomerase [cf. Phormidesmis sp. LEGE 11477]